jgi:hypothetical protein
MVKFTGSVNKQSAAGEAVTITVNKPDGGVDNVSANTLDDKSFSVDYFGAVGVGYSAVAIIAEDVQYLAATSNTVTFDMGKESRTITLNVA